MQATPKNLHQSTEWQIRILSGGAYQAAKGVDFPPHLHSQWELVYYRSGAIGCVMDGRSRPGYPGLAWLTPPGVVHAERARTAYSNYYIALEIKGATWPAFLDDNADRSLERVCQQIVLECQRNAPDRARMLRLLAEQLGCLLQRSSSELTLSRPAQLVARAERVIDEKCGQPLTIRDVARAVHASETTLRDHFQAVRGCSPRQHLAQVRLGRATGLLRTSTLKLEAIAEMCGYDSTSHLTRCVKKAMGKTPGALRKQARLPGRG